MLSCKEITEKANSYLDKELPFYTRMQVKLHLMMCVHCQRYIHQLRATINALGKLKKDTPVSEHVVDDIVTSLHQMQQKPDKPEN
jgi:anti-sigma factor ChrR (cupin superfamily)